MNRVITFFAAIHVPCSCTLLWINGTVQKLGIYWLLHLSLVLALLITKRWRLKDCVRLLSESAAVKIFQDLNLCQFARVVHPNKALNFCISAKTICLMETVLCSVVDTWCFILAEYEFSVPHWRLQLVFQYRLQTASAPWGSCKNQRVHCKSETDKILNVLQNQWVLIY